MVYVIEWTQFCLCFCCFRCAVAKNKTITSWYGLLTVNQWWWNIFGDGGGGHGRRHRGDGGDVSPRFEILGYVPQEITIFKENLVHICQSSQIFQYFLNKVVEIRGEIGIWGQVVLIYLNPSPPVRMCPPSRKFVATPLALNIKWPESDHLKTSIFFSN